MATYFSKKNVFSIIFKGKFKNELFLIKKTVYYVCKKWKNDLAQKINFWKNNFLQKKFFGGGANSLAGPEGRE